MDNEIQKIIPNLSLRDLLTCTTAQYHVRLWVNIAPKPPCASAFDENYT